ncbi:MAG: pseudouridine synthase [Pirellulales bacterium]|nr:pseudouridine synthase [Pirellulales bacterium]
MPPRYPSQPPRPANDQPGQDPLDPQTAHWERLQKVLASAGLGSRRACEELITTGRVEVDGQVITKLGTKVDPSQQTIRVDGEPLPKPKLRYFLVNKPLGVVTTNSDPAGRERVIDLVRSDARLFPVGRLDKSSEGLIIVTNDGDLANLLAHPRYGVEKTYLALVAGEPTRQVLEKLREGVHLAEGWAHAKSVKLKAKQQHSTLLEIVLDEGRNREVRRLLARVGHKVLRLQRISQGPLRLGDLKSGEYRPLTLDEVAALKQAAADAIAAGPTKKRPPRKTFKNTLDNEDLDELSGLGRSDAPVDYEDVEDQEAGDASAPVSPQFPTPAESATEKPRKRRKKEAVADEDDEPALFDSEWDAADASDSTTPVIPDIWDTAFGHYQKKGSVIADEDDAGEEDAPRKSRSKKASRGQQAKDPVPSSKLSDSLARVKTKKPAAPANQPIIDLSIKDSPAESETEIPPSPPRKRARPPVAQNSDDDSETELDNDDDFLEGFPGIAGDETAGEEESAAKGPRRKLRPKGFLVQKKQHAQFKRKTDAANAERDARRAARDAERGYGPRATRADRDADRPSRGDASPGGSAERDRPDRGRREGTGLGRGGPGRNRYERSGPRRDGPAGTGRRAPGGSGPRREAGENRESYGDRRGGPPGRRGTDDRRGGPGERRGYAGTRGAGARGDASERGGSADRTGRGERPGRAERGERRPAYGARREGPAPRGERSGGFRGSRGPRPERDSTERSGGERGGPTRDGGSSGGGRSGYGARSSYGAGGRGASGRGGSGYSGTGRGGPARGMGGRGGPDRSENRSSGRSAPPGKGGPRTGRSGGKPGGSTGHARGAGRFNRPEGGPGGKSGPRRPGGRRP